MENQEMDTGFADFMANFDEDLGNQTEPDEEVNQTGEENEVSEENQNPDAEEPAEEIPQEQDKTGDEENPATPTEETYTIKVNKEERICTREELISLAQKGADYDRVRERLAGQQETMDLLAELAKDSNTDIPGLLDSFRLNLLMKRDGLSEDVAKERLARQKLEKENAELKAAKADAPTKAETAKERAQRELADFRANYPKVEMTEELADKLMPDIKSGLSMTQAYRNYEAAQKDARIAELELQLEAQKQNAANRISSPGSQKDSGGRRTKSEIEEFLRALE